MSRSHSIALIDTFGVLSRLSTIDEVHVTERPFCDVKYCFRSQNRVSTAYAGNGTGEVSP